MKKIGIYIGLVVIVLLIVVGALLYLFYAVEEEEPDYVCGNGICEPGENYINCPEDCAPPGEKPIADAGGPYECILGEEFEIDGTGSTDSDGTVVMWEWDMNNDGTYEFNGAQKSVISNLYWSVGGEYEIMLKVTDNDGYTGTEITTVTITEPEHCGNGICEPEKGENCQTCPQDCGPCAEEPQGLGVRPPYVPINNGDTFWIYVYLDPPQGQKIGAWVIDLSYDTNYLTAIDVDPADSEWEFFDDGTINNGVIEDVQAWTTLDPDYKTLLFKVKFEAINSGITALTFTDVKIADELAQVIDIVINDRVLEIN